MSNSRYYIVGNNDVWMIQFKDTENGHYKSSNELASFAIAAAQKLGMRGERAHVCVLDDYGHLRCKWTYNRDGHRGLAARNSPQKLVRSHVEHAIHPRETCSGTNRDREGV